MRRQFYWNPWFQDRRVYFVPLPPDRCHELLLQSSSRQRDWFNVRMARLGPGILTRRDDLWFYCPTFWSRNASRPYARVRLRKVPTGSGVDVLITATPTWRAAVAALYGLAGFITFLSFASFASFASWQALYMALLGVAFLGLMLLINAIGRWFAADDPRHLLSHVRERLGIIATSSADAP